MRSQMLASLRLDPRTLLVSLGATALLAAGGREVVADPIRVLQSDESGVTLELSLSGYSLQPDRSAGTLGAGRMLLTVPGLGLLDSPGRPKLPVASTLIGLPPGASPTLRVLEASADEERSGVRLSIGTEPTFRENPSGRDLIPARQEIPPVLDGVWPTGQAQLGPPFGLRRQRLVAVEFRPFRYDERSNRLWFNRRLKVRVDFGAAKTAIRSGAAPTEDRHWDAVFQEAVLNHAQSRGWREPAQRAVKRAIPIGSGLAPTPGSLLAPTRPGETSGALGGFDENFDEVRIKVDTTGFYRFDYIALSNYGYPAGIPIGQVSVHRHEFIENSSPPYVTIELPIEIEEGTTPNGIFDAGDRLFVYVQNWAERSGASLAQRHWGDAEVVYVTANAGGQRIGSRPGWRNFVGLAPLASYPWTQRWEKNFFYFFSPDDTLSDQNHWTEVTPYYARPEGFNFETNHLDTVPAVSFSVIWQGRRSSSHFTWAQIHKGPSQPFITIADSVSWFGKVSHTDTAVLPGSVFGEGNVNTMRVWGKGSSGPPDPVTNAVDASGVNSIEATYWRRFRALASYLSANNAGASGPYQILATGFASSSGGADLKIFDVTDPIAPVRLTVDASHIQQVGSEFNIEFQDSVGVGEARKYAVFTSSSARRVPASSYSRVTRRQLTNHTAGDYLIVVPEAFLAQIGPLASFRNSQGLQVVTSPLESLFDEFNGGRRSDFAIKRFIEYGYENWDTRFVVLVGDGSEDPLNFQGNSSTDWIPIHKINGPVFANGFEIVPADPWYGCFTNCALGPSPVLQDVWVGRLPVQTAQETQDLVTKLIDYENFSATQTWRNTNVLSSDDEYSGDSFFGGGSLQAGYCRRPSEVVFRLLNETIARVIALPDSAGLQQSNLPMFNLSYYTGTQVTCPPSPLCTPGGSDTCRVSREDTQLFTHANATPAMFGLLNNGCLWWNYQGHANEFVLAHEDLYINRAVEDDKDKFSNLDRPFLFSAFSCHANAFARTGDVDVNRGPSIGEEMLLLPDRGAIASWASTGYEILPGNGIDHVNVSLAKAMFFTPPKDPYIGDRGARVVLGEAIGLALLRFLSQPFVPFYERGVSLTYNLLGDPATRLSIGPPQSIVTANTLPVVDDQPVRLHTAGDSLRLEADLVSSVELEAIALERTDASGLPVVIPSTDYTLTPTFPDTVLGGRRYHVSYRTTLQANSYRYTFRTTDRYQVTGAFDVVFQFLTQLRLDNQVLAPNDAVPPDANLSLQVLSPRPIDPLTELALTINSAAQAFTATPVPGDTSGREWTLAWTHAPYALGEYVVRLTVTGGAERTHTFQVLVGGTELLVQNPLAFPNPFEEDLGTHFSFSLVSVTPSNVLIRVFTPSGRVVYQREERGLHSGYHQLAWNGRDAEGSHLANGVYFYRLLASNGTDKAEHLGRLVKLRKPRRADDSSSQ